MDSSYNLGRARTEKEIGECCRLVVKEYERSSYLPISQDNIYQKFYSRMKGSSAAVFFVSRGDEIMGTVTVMRDTGGGSFPMEEIYGDEVECLRKTGKALAEVTQFAIRNSAQGSDAGLNERFLIVLKLFSLVYYYSLARGIDALCISINPKHESFYRSLGFKAIGGLKYYPSFNNAPALAKFLDLRDIAAEIKSGVGPGFFREIINVKPDEDFFRDP